MPSKESSCWQLFTSVRPLFASDIPWEVQHDNQHRVSAEDIENKGNLIKACMLEIPFHVSTENFDFDRFALFIVNDLRPFLLTLQELVDDGIVGYVDIATIDDSDPELLKLNTLSYMMQSLTTDAFDAGEYLGFLCLNQDYRHLMKVSTGIENLNKRLMAEMSKNGLDRSAIPKPKSASRSIPNNPMSWLQTTSNPSFWSASQQLFKALVCNLGSCKSSTHSAMLNLKSLESPKARDERAEFNLLLPSCPKRDFWQETSCHVLYKNSYESDVEEDVLQGDVCTTVRTANDYSSILRIRVHEESFRCECYGDQPPIYPEALPTMTVSKLIESGFLTDLCGFNFKDRWILALNLARSLLQLHNGPWLQTLWTSDALIFLCENLKEGRKLCNIHNPFISCTISDSPPSPPKRKPFDEYPLLLTFGQFLLELAIGKKLPVTTTKAGDFSPYLTLKSNLKGENTGSLSNDYNEAIEGCLNFHKYLRDEKDPDMEVRIRTTIFKKVVQPLERNLSLFSKITESAGIRLSRTTENGPLLDGLNPKDLLIKDGILLEAPQVSGPIPLRISQSHALQRTVNKRVETVNESGNLSLQFPTAENKAAACQSTTTFTIQRLQHDCEQSSNGDASSSSESELEYNAAGGRLLGTFDTNNGLHDSASLEWRETFKRLSRTYDRHFQYTSSDEPVKVAILDTGVDLNHPDFQHPRSRPRKGGIISPVEEEEKQIDRIKACQNFCDDREDVGDVLDIDGHGTHVAGIILQLAPRAELYIARVCEGDERYGRSALASEANVPNEMLKQSADAKVHPHRVERAIKWAITQGVHLINMSFGYKDWDEKLDEVLEEAGRHGIVIFAAASNSGNHEPVSWPARDRDRAICVHSSTDLGKTSNFTPEADSKTTNFMVVGEMVCSHWPVSKGGGFRDMSGTSAATPVATAIAALLLAFTRQDVVDKEKKKDVEEKTGPARLEELRNMRPLLERISKKVRDYYWVNPQLLWSTYNPTASQRNNPKATSNHAWEEIRMALRR